MGIQTFLLLKDLLFCLSEQKPMMVNWWWVCLWWASLNKSYKSLTNLLLFIPSRSSSDYSLHFLVALKWASTSTITMADLCIVILTFQIFLIDWLCVYCRNWLLCTVFKAAINRYCQFNAVIDIFAISGVLVLIHWPLHTMWCVSWPQATNLQVFFSRVNLSFYF